MSTVPVKLAMAYATIAKMEARIHELESAQPAALVTTQEPVGYRSRFIKEPDHWYVAWGKPLPEDPNPHAEYQLIYTHADAAEVEQLESIVRGQRQSLDIVAEQVENLQKMVAEQDALLRDLRQYVNLSPGWNDRVDAALSATAPADEGKP